MARTRRVATLLAVAFGTLPAAVAAGAPTPVAVFPTPGAQFAQPRSQIAFRGLAADQLGAIAVSGSRSGRHTGRIAADSDGLGGSFLPARPFTPGELVTVRTSLDLLGAATGRFQFRVATPAGTIFPVPRPSSPRVPNDVLRFETRPDLVPAAVSISRSSSSAAGGDIFVAPQAGPVQDGAAIFDPSGELVWFHPVTGIGQVSDFKVQSYEGQPVLTWWQGYTDVGVGVGTDLIFDRAYRQIAAVRAANGLGADLHEFRISPTGTALITAYYPVDADASSVRGSKHENTLDSVVQEIDISTGLLLFQWDSLDHVPLADSEVPLPNIAGYSYDYFHVNSVAIDSDGSPVISARNTWAAYKLDHSTGAIIWRLNGKHSSFKMGPGSSFAFQHDVELHPGGVATLFDDGAGPPNVHTQSRALALRLDTRRMTATRISQSEHAPPLLAAFEGNTQTLVNGDEFVGWGQQPNFTEFNSRGQAVFDGHFVGNNSNYRAYRFPWSAQPANLPAVTADVGTGPFTTVHTSWNGATDVAAWRVLAGPSPAELRTVTSAPRRGFETAITVAGRNTYVAVEALDPLGRTLATSGTATVRSRIVNVGTNQFVAPGGQPGVLLACFGAHPCTGQLTLSAGPTVLARRRRETIGADTGGIVHLSLSNAGRSALAHAHGRPIGARLTVSDLDGGGESTLITLVPFTTSGRPATSTTTESGSVHILGPTAFVSPRGPPACHLDALVSTLQRSYRQCRRATG